MTHFLYIRLKNSGRFRITKKQFLCFERGNKKKKTVEERVGMKNEDIRSRHAFAFSLSLFPQHFLAFPVVRMFSIFPGTYSYVSSVK